MRIIDLLLPEYDREMGLARRVLERVPEEQFAFQPHPRSMSLGKLASHLAQIPSWASATMRGTALELAMSDARVVLLDTTAALLATFDRHVREGRQQLVDASDAELQVPWSFIVDDAVLFTMPRVTVLRTWVLNHAVHHRGQLTVYLRLLEVPLPPLYGPSADEEKT